MTPRNGKKTWTGDSLAPHSVYVAVKGDVGVLGTDRVTLRSVATACFEDDRGGAYDVYQATLKDARLYAAVADSFPKSVGTAVDVLRDVLRPRNGEAMLQGAPPGLVVDVDVATWTARFAFSEANVRRHGFGRDFHVIGGSDLGCYVAVPKKGG
jgi:hypothetical protein